MRRRVMAVVLVGVLAGLALWLFPGRSGDDAALAAVARAMANVTSAHFVRWQLDPASGEKRRHEMWVKGASKMRHTIEASDFDAADNGEMLVTLRNYNGVYTAWIEPPKRVRGMKSEMSYLDLFVGGQGLTSILEANAYMVESVSPGALPDGDQATVIELRHMDGRKAVLVVDARSNLLTQWKEYDRSGKLIINVDSIEYNTEIPDSTFGITIPEGTPVIDRLTPPSPDIVAARRAEEARLRAAGWEGLGSLEIGMCGTPYHDGLLFQSLNRNGIAVFYRRDRNVYHVVGRALVFARGGAFKQVVEDVEIPAPGKPDLSRAEASFRLNPRVQAAEGPLRRAGGKEILKMQEGLGSCGSPYHSKLRFQVLRDDGCLIMYMPDRNAYHIFGKVRVFGMGLDKVVENGEIEAPGPPDGPEE